MGELRFDHMASLQLNRSEMQSKLKSLQNPINEKQYMYKLKQYIEFLDREIADHG